MEEADLLIKELRIDNETILTSDYNPVKQLFDNKRSSISYRNTYHRLERIMEQIININYKGFSDSVLSYMEIYNLNINCCKNLKEIKNLLYFLKDIKFDITDIKSQFEETSYYKIKMKIIDNLVHLSDLLQVRPTEEFSMCTNFMNILDTLNSKLINIQGVNTINNEIEQEIEKFMILIFDKIFEYIFKDKIENKQFLRIVQMMNFTDKFSKYLKDNLDCKILKLRPEKYPWDYIVLENEKIMKIDSFKLNNIKHNLDEVTKFLKIKPISQKLEKYRKKETKRDDLFLLLIFEDERYKRIDFTTNTIYLYKLCDKEISVDLLIKKIKQEYDKNNVNIFLVNTLTKFNEKYKNKNLTNLVFKYLDMLNNGLIDEIMYLFDIYCREGNFKNQYYINKIIYTIDKNFLLVNYRGNDVIKKIIVKINEYVKVNKIDNGEFVKAMKLVDEILGEFESSTRIEIAV